MARKPRGTPKISESEKLHERAVRCQRLAVGADDPKFSLKLNALADEYEAKSAQASDE